MTMLRKMKLLDDNNNIINPAEQPTLDAIAQNVYRMKYIFPLLHNDKIFDAVFRVNANPFSDNDNNPNYYGYLELANDKILFGGFDSYINHPFLIADNEDYNSATHIWIAYNHDVGGSDNWQIRIDNENLLKGAPVENYELYEGNIFFAGHLSTVIADTTTHDLLRKWVTINDQTYDNCQRISLAGKMIAKDSNRIIFEFEKSILDFPTRNNTALFGFVCYSTIEVVAAEIYHWAAWKWEVEIVEKFGDPTKLHAVICNQNLAHAFPFNLENCAENYFYLFVGRPVIKTDWENMMSAADLIYLPRELDQNGRVSIMSYASAALSLTILEYRNYTASGDDGGRRRVKI